MTEEDRQWLAEQFSGISERVASLEASATTSSPVPEPVSEPAEEVNTEVSDLRSTIAKMEHKIATLASQPIRRGRIEMRPPMGVDADNAWRSMAASVKEGDHSSSLAGLVERNSESLTDETKATRRELQDMLSKGISAAVADGLINMHYPTTSWQ